MKRLVWILLAAFVLTAGLSIYLTKQLAKKSCGITKAEIRAAKYQDSLKTAEDSIGKLLTQLQNERNFILDNDDQALDYLDKFAGERNDWSAFITNRLLETNNGNKDNPLIPYQGMYGKMKINSIRILNHKWIIADFTDGKVWGQVLLEYEPVGRDSIRFHTIKALMYPFKP